LATFNLFTEPWIPTSSGDMALRDIFQGAHTIERVTAETPVITFSLARLLTAITHAVMPVNTPQEWAALFAKGEFDDRVLYYLYQHKDRFDLFDLAHPFFQWVHVPERSDTPVNKLPLHLASGTTVTLISDAIDGTVSLPYAEVARNLVTIQYFGMGGLSGYRAITSFDSSPLCFRVLAMPEGRNVFETILFNLVPGSFYPTTKGDIPDRPCWEQENPFGAERSLPFGPNDYLTWLPRKILLFPDEEREGYIRELRWIPSQNRFPKDSLLRDPAFVMGQRGGDAEEDTATDEEEENTQATQKKKKKAEPAEPFALRGQVATGSPIWHKALTGLLTPHLQPLTLTWLQQLHREGHMPGDCVPVTVCGTAGDRSRFDGQFCYHVTLALDETGQTAQRERLKLAQKGSEVARAMLWGKAMELSCSKKTLAVQAVLSPWLGHYWQQIELRWRMDTDDWRAAVEQVVFDLIVSISAAAPRTEEADSRLRTAIAERMDD